MICLGLHAPQVARALIQSQSLQEVFRHPQAPLLSEEELKQIKSNTIGIWIDQSNSQTKFCTGVYWRENKFLTAEHCLKDFHEGYVEIEGRLLDIKAAALHKNSGSKPKSFRLGIGQLKDYADLAWVSLDPEELSKQLNGKSLTPFSITPFIAKRNQKTSFLVFGMGMKRSLPKDQKTNYDDVLSFRNLSGMEIQSKVSVEGSFIRGVTHTSSSLENSSLVTYGDSGGPVFQRSLDGKLALIGILSFISEASGLFEDRNYTFFSLLQAIESEVFSPIELE